MTGTAPAIKPVGIDAAELPHKRQRCRVEQTKAGARQKPRSCRQFLIYFSQKFSADPAAFLAHFSRETAGIFIVIKVLFEWPVKIIKKPRAECLILLPHRQPALRVRILQCPDHYIATFLNDRSIGQH